MLTWLVAKSRYCTDPCAMARTISGSDHMIPKGRRELLLRFLTMWQHPVPLQDHPWREEYDKHQFQIQTSTTNNILDSPFPTVSFLRIWLSHRKFCLECRLTNPPERLHMHLTFVAPIRASLNYGPLPVDTWNVEEVCWVRGQNDYHVVLFCEMSATGTVMLQNISCKKGKLVKLQKSSLLKNLNIRQQWNLIVSQGFSI